MTVDPERLYYLASPYSNPSPIKREHNHYLARDIAGRLMAKGYLIFASINSTHDIAKKFQLPTDHEWWIKYNKCFIDASAGIIVCNIPGWKESRGVRQEIDYARSIGLPVYLIDQSLTIEEI